MKLALPKLSRVIGAFRILRRRAVEVDRPGLAMWADAGERAAGEVKAAVRDGAHAAESGALAVESELRAMLADGKISGAELERLQRLPARAHRVAEKCHDVGEVAS